MIEQLRTEYPIQVICDVTGYSRSRYYYQPNEAKQETEEELKTAITDVGGRYPTYGYRREPVTVCREKLDCVESYP